MITTGDQKTDEALQRAMFFPHLKYSSRLCVGPGLMTREEGVTGDRDLIDRSPLLIKAYRGRLRSVGIRIGSPM